MAFSQEIADKVLEGVASGRSLASVLRDPGTPSYAAFMVWLKERPELQDNYARAIEMRADVKFDELDDVSEEAAGAESAVQVAGLRLKADNIKWQLARMNSKKYGEKATTEHTGPGGGPLQIEEVRRTVIDPKVSPDGTS